ncbi:SRPBCC domain-containing protein [Leucobacter sp. CSA1]|uniref:SRPBCC domain-containing protein n=1 Tax=Leucobacter chromiisoli TaxID=2796471 RepID=A0A934Q9P3_9MICO|nr:SRPBCC domain-containing protein [Leucobacter chromiisoli]MBK0419845.1 SRPBCC domain-containing protein [Leucobacter chromiisoli]
MSTDTAPQTEAGRIEIEREFPAARERVFARWTDAEALGRWFAPPGYSTLHSESDPRPGGAWRLDFRADTGDHRYTERGEFREVRPFERLVLTLTQFDDEHANPNTLVSVSLDDIGTPGAPRTRMRFVQSGYRSPALRDDNEQGWRECFDGLARELKRAETRRSA